MSGRRGMGTTDHSMTEFLPCVYHNLEICFFPGEKKYISLTITQSIGFLQRCNIEEELPVIGAWNGERGSGEKAKSYPRKYVTHVMMCLYLSQKSNLFEAQKHISCKNIPSNGLTGLHAMLFGNAYGDIVYKITERHCMHLISIPCKRNVFIIA